MDKTTDNKRPGRPPKPLPPPIDDTPENVARAILGTPPKRREDWRFIREQEGAP